MAADTEVGHQVPLDEDGFQAAVDQLVADDAAMAAVVAIHGRPVFWSRPASFATLVLLILEQQVSLAAGKAVFDRLRERVGRVAPAVVAEVPVTELQAVGMTRQKAAYVSGLARGVVAGEIDWALVTGSDPGPARRALLAVRGIGPWTADVWLLACLRAPDVWPVGDRALQVGVAEVVGHPEPLTGERLATAGRRWAPHRSTAARLVWHAYLARRERRETVVEGLLP